MRDELLRYLSEAWTTIVDTDVDGARAEPRAVDEGSPRFGSILAGRRVARTIFMGSAPHVQQQAPRGIEEVRVRLGVVQPGEPVAVFNDALGRLGDRLRHLYNGNRRYWYDTQPNLKRTMEDRAGRLESADVEHEIVTRLKATKDRQEFRAVHVCVPSADIPDEASARLVILPPAAAHKANHTGSPALRAATDILDAHGNGPRILRNMLLFVAADQDQMQVLQQATRVYLAWSSIVDDADTLNLDAHQRREAEDGKKRSDETLATRLNEAYCWLLVPTQEGNEEMRWEATRLPGGQESPAAKAARKVRTSEQLITRWSPVLLCMELDRWLWKDENHVGLKRVWQCLASYLYLPRLRDEQVFIDAVREGLRSREYFAYASSVTADGKYIGLQAGSGAGSIYLDGQSVLVKPEAAARQLEAEAAAIVPVNGGYKPGNGTTAGVPVKNGKGAQPVAPPATPAGQPTAFHGSVQLSPLTVSGDAQKVALEVIQHLTSLYGAQVKVTLEISANMPDGAPDHVVRTVTENCQTLGFTSQGFEGE